MHTHIEYVAENASFYLNRTYDHHSYYYKPYLNEITGIINHLSTYIYSSPFFNSQNPKQAVLLLLETWDYKYPALIEFNWIVTFKAVFIIHFFFPSSMATFYCNSVQFVDSYLQTHSHTSSMSNNFTCRGLICPLPFTMQLIRRYTRDPSMHSPWVEVCGSECSRPNCPPWDHRKQGASASQLLPGVCTPKHIGCC